MSTVTETTSAPAPRLAFEFGTFEGFNFRAQCAILKHLTAAEVIAWDPDRDGEAEFWPAGGTPAVELIFQRRTVTAAELLDLERLLTELGGDSTTNYLRLHHAVNIRGLTLENLNREQVEDTGLDIFMGSNFTDVRREAAYELFELYYPEEYQAWKKSHCDGLSFDTEVFLRSPVFSVEEVRLGDKVAVMVASQ